MLLDPVTWMPASRSEEVLAALDPDVARAHRRRDARLGARAGHRSARDRRRGGRAARRAARRARPAARSGWGWRPPWPAPTRSRAGRTPRSPPARATSSSTRRCASSPGASRRSRCTCTSPCPTSAPAVRALDGLREQLPLLLALSANSPFWQGRDSGLASARIPVFQAFPRTGTPRSFGTYEDYVEAVDVLIRCDAIPEPTFLWWDARLQPRLGTIEVRIMDAQTRVRDTAALAALVQCLVRREALERDDGRACPTAPEVLEENRFLASRDGDGRGVRRPRRRAAACRSRISSRRRCGRARRTPSGCAAGASWRRSSALAERPGSAAPARGRHAVRRACAACCARCTATSSARARSAPSPRWRRLEIGRAGRRADGLCGAGRRLGLPAGGVAEAGALEHLQRQQRALHPRGGDVDPEQVEHEVAGRASAGRRPASRSPRRRPSRPTPARSRSRGRRSGRR